MGGVEAGVPLPAPHPVSALVLRAHSCRLVLAPAAVRHTVAQLSRPHTQRSALLLLNYCRLYPLLFQITCGSNTSTWAVQLNQPGRRGHGSSVETALEVETKVMMVMKETGVDMAATCC